MTSVSYIIVAPSRLYAFDSSDILLFIPASCFNVSFTVSAQESLIPSDKAEKFSDYADVIDFYVCSRSDVFVPAFSRLFHASVVGQRIALGKTQIYDPAQVTSSEEVTSSKVDDYTSFYISRKNHWAYSCFC